MITDRKYIMDNNSLDNILGLCYGNFMALYSFVKFINVLDVARKFPVIIF